MQYKKIRSVTLCTLLSIRLSCQVMSLPKYKFVFESTICILYQPLKEWIANLLDYPTLAGLSVRSFFQFFSKAFCITMEQWEAFTNFRLLRLQFNHIESPYSYLHTFSIYSCFFLSVTSTFSLKFWHILVLWDNSLQIIKFWIVQGKNKLIC